MTKNDVIDMAIRSGIPSVNVPSLAFGRVETGLELLESFAKLVAAKEQARCCSIVYGMAGSDNVAQRTVDAIRGQK